LKDLFGSSPAAAPPADSAVCADPRSTVAPQLQHPPAAGPLNP
jgi:hypothetical protein